MVILANLIVILFAKETIHYAQNETKNNNPQSSSIQLSFSTFFWITSFRNRILFSASQAGLIEKFVNVIVWFGYPLYFSTFDIPIKEMGLIVASYGFSSGFLQLVTGPLSDRIGRKPLIVIGILISGIGTLGIVIFDGLLTWIIIASIIGIGMAMLYQTLLALVSDVAEQFWR